MAQFVLGTELEEDLVRQEKERKEQENQEKARRHYKKDSRYLEDLYTLTYQEDSLDREEEVEPPRAPQWGLSSYRAPQPLASLQVGGRGPGPGLTRSLSSGPLSLGGPVGGQGDSRMQFTSSTLDTNLHKILARRMVGGQGVSLRSCKLLTRAYYSLLREEGRAQSPSLQLPAPRPQPPREDPKLDWSTLLQTDGQQLRNIVAGYSALVRGLNDELMVELMSKDELGAKQDLMLDEISELTDSLL